MSGCSHGKTFKEPCTECQLVLAREGLAWALQSVEKYSKLIADLAPDASGPWIERGTGWAKIHNLPPTHLLNEPQPTPEMVSDLVAGLKYVAEFPINNSQRQHAQQVLGRFASLLTRPESK